MNWQKQWDDKLATEYQECSWDEVQQLLKDAYKIALNDKSYQHQYTHLILFNLQLLAEYGIEKISFKQWKSFRAYVNDVKRQNIKITDLFKNN
jgi:hypothetical protein